MLLHGRFSNQLILKPVVGSAYSAMATQRRLSPASSLRD